MPEIDILMAAYNGEKYISEQVESILSQTFTDWRLLIRDDGSNDNTPAIIEEYAAKYPGKIEVIHDDAVCRNATKNFFELLKHAEADYVMFCDQDDVWLPYKIQITYDYMKKAERENPDKPVLIFTGLQIVDAELRSMDQLMSLNFPERRYTFKELILGNCAAGCTEMLNRKCYKGMGGFHEGIKYHDWWASLYASAFGVIVRVPMALILYRQHGDNAVGATKELNNKRGFTYYLNKIWEYCRNPLYKITDRITRMKSLIKETHINCRNYRSLFDSLPPEKLKELDEISELFGKSIFTRIKAMRKCSRLYCFSHGYTMSSSISRILWVILAGREN